MNSNTRRPGRSAIAAFRVSARILTALALGTAALCAVAAPSHAASPRHLTPSDFFGVQAFDEASPLDSVVMGVTYAPVFGFHPYGKASLLTHKFPGYVALRFSVAIPDTGYPGEVSHLWISGDGKQIEIVAAKYAQPPVKVTIPFGNYTSISLAAGGALDGGGVVLIDPTLVPAQSSPQPVAPQPAPPAGTVPTTLQLFAPSVAPGGQETALVTTAATATVTLVIAYPDGSQQVMGPKRSDAEGHLVFNWSVPAGEHGTVRLVAVGTGVTQASFSVQ